jgi:hypothetical protein
LRPSGPVPPSRADRSRARRGTPRSGVVLTRRDLAMVAVNTNITQAAGSPQAPKAVYRLVICIMRPSLMWRTSMELCPSSYAKAAKLAFNDVSLFGLLSLHRLPLDEEHPRQPAFAERVAEDAEGEKRNEHQ